jgi:hypothetical protein
VGRSSFSGCTWPGGNKYGPTAVPSRNPYCDPSLASASTGTASTFEVLRTYPPHRSPQPRLNASDWTTVVTAFASGRTVREQRAPAGAPLRTRTLSMASLPSTVSVGLFAELPSFLYSPKLVCGSYSKISCRSSTPGVLKQP